MPPGDCVGCAVEARVRQGRHRRRKRRDESESLSRMATARAAHEEQGSSWANLICGVTSDLQRQEQVGLNISACLFKIEFGQRRVVWTWASYQHVVDRSGQFVKELR